MDVNVRIFLFLVFATIVSCDRVTSPDSDSYYVDPNRYSQNQHVQEVLRKYSQDPRYNSNNPLPQDILDKLSSTPDPRYGVGTGNYAGSSYRPNRPYPPSGRVDIANVDRYGNSQFGTNNDRNRQRYDVYPEPGRGDPPRQYFENDPQYSLREDEIIKILAQIDISASQQCNINVRAQWDFETNVNDVNQIRAVSAYLTWSLCIFFFLVTRSLYTDLKLLNPNILIRI